MILRKVKVTAYFIQQLFQVFDIILLITFQLTVIMLAFWFHLVKRNLKIFHLQSRIISNPQADSRRNYFHKSRVFRGYPIATP